MSSQALKKNDSMDKISTRSYIAGGPASGNSDSADSSSDSKSIPWFKGFRPKHMHMLTQESSDTTGTEPMPTQESSDTTGTEPMRDVKSFIPPTEIKCKNQPQVFMNAEVACKALVPAEAAINSFFINNNEDVFSKRTAALRGSEYPDTLQKWLTADGKSLSRGAVHMRAYNDEKEGTVYLTFSGFSKQNLRSDLKFIFKSFFGKETKEIKNALEAVDAFQKHYPNKRIVLTGHSMGGAFSTYCGIKKELPTINFNGMGLSRRLLRKLSSEHKLCQIFHINTHKDWLTQFVQRPVFVQPGERFGLPGYSGHALSYNNAAKGRTFLSDEIYRLSRNK
jgi:hypothetical protein